MLNRATPAGFQASIFWLVFGEEQRMSNPRNRWNLVPLAVLSAGIAAGGVAQSPLQRALNDDVASHWIYDDYDSAVREARSSNKPVMAVLRCVP